MISFQTPSATLHCGDALAELRAIPADSVHMCVTSPPYWGLRAYGTPPQVWGGAEGGEHLWGDEARRGGPQGGQGSTSQRRGRNSAPAQSRQNDSMGAFCQCCGAWRGELGLEPTIDLYIEHMVSIFDEVRRVLRPDGTLWLNMGDSYACKPNGRSAAATKAAGGDDRTFRDKPATGFGALKEKDLVGQPWRIAFALQAAGWWLRSDIIWAKFNGMPNSVDDRPGCAHEYLFLLSKSKHYFYDWYAIRERAPYGRRQWSNVKGNLAGLGINGARGHATVSGEGDGWRNKRSVWRINSQASGEEHFAAFPPDLVKPCILAGTSEYGCCAGCGKPYTRIVEKSGGTTGKDRNPEKSLEKGSSPASRADNGDGSYRVEHRGWKKPCRCLTDERTPGVCLDPFSGTGTVGLVALQLGRRYLGIELAEKYCRMQRKRLLSVTPPIPELAAL